MRILSIIFLILFIIIIVYAEDKLQITFYGLTILNLCWLIRNHFSNIPMLKATPCLNDNYFFETTIDNQKKICIFISQIEVKNIGIKDVCLDDFELKINNLRIPSKIHHIKPQKYDMSQVYRKTGQCLEFIKPKNGVSTIQFIPLALSDNNLIKAGYKQQGHLMFATEINDNCQIESDTLSADLTIIPVFGDKATISNIKFDRNKDITKFGDLSSFPDLYKIFENME